MKIVFISGIGRGGTERVMTLIANNLYTRKHNVTIITNNEGEPAFKLIPEIKIIKVQVEKEWSLLRGIKYRKNLRNIIKEVNPNVVVTFSAMEGILTILSLIFTSIPIIISERTHPFKSIPKIWWRIVRFLVYPKAKGFVFLTEESLKLHPVWVRRKSIIIENPINPSIPGKYNGEKRNEIITVGRLIEAKNQILLINAFEKVKMKHPNYTLKIYGDGPLKSLLENRTRELGIEKYVYFMGMVDNVFEQMNYAEIFVLTSNYEGLPNALLEAMALGLPCITTDCEGGGARTIIINNKNGLLIPRNDLNTLINSLNYLIENKDYAKKLSDESLKVKNTYACQKIVDKWENFIQDAVNKGRRLN